MKAKMKNKLFLVPMLSLAFVALTGCANEKTNLTYGTKITQSITSLKPTSDFDIFFRAEYFKETFIVATYQKGLSEDCLCWNTFQNVIVNYMNKYQEKVYVFDSQNETAKLLKIDQYKDSTPALYIFKGKKQLAKFVYKNNRDKSIFTELNAEPMYERIHKYINRPSLYEVNDQYLTDNLNKLDEAVTLFVRFSCEDCSYAVPSVIIPYFSNNISSKEVLIFDLEDYYTLYRSDSSTEEEKALYQNIKDKYQLSETTNATYGYKQGVVPTIQYYKKGILKSACVFFNDEVAQKEDGSYYISNSYFSQERLTSLSYAKDVKNNVLKGMTLNKDEVVSTPSGYTYWAQEKAAIYHKPLFEAFMNYYCK